MVDEARSRGGKGRKFNHAAVLLILGGAAIASFGKGLFPSPTSATLTATRTVLHRAGVRQVPDEYATIQEAINAAQYGETILVTPGIYPERLTIEAKRLELRGSGVDGIVHVIGDGSHGPVISVNGLASSGTTIDGFAVTGGIGADGSGLKVDQAAVIVRNGEFTRNEGGGAVSLAADIAYYGCTFEENGSKVAGGGLRHEGGSATLTNCLVKDNTAGTFGAGLYSHAGTATIINTRITGNATVSGAWGGGIYSDASELLAINSVIEGNGAVDSGGGLYVSGGEATLSGCTLSGNYSERGWSIGNSGGIVRLNETQVCGQREWATLGDGIEAQTEAFDANCQTDLNMNGRNDAEEIKRGWSRDCDVNGVPDDFDPDCNTNGFVDRCEIAQGWVVDCNGNGVPDSCEIEMGLAPDADGDHRIDGCATEE